ncbi:MAG: nuclear transport factor 2 family protein [Parafilimonas sp.]
MKLKNVSILCSFFIMCVKAYSQPENSDSIKYSSQIIRIEQQLLDAITSGDTVVWSKYLDEEYYIITEDGTGYNKNEFLLTFRALPKGFSGYINLIEPHFIFKNNIAIIHYVSDEYEFVFGQKIHTTYSTADTYFKTDTSWKMIASQVFEIPQLPPAIKVSGSVLKNYTGIYQLSDSVTCTISLENDTPFIQKKGRKKEALFAETENIFFRQSDTRGRKIFTKDEQGNMLMRERRNGEDVIWKRIKLLE